MKIISLFTSCARWRINKVTFIFLMCLAMPAFSQSSLKTVDRLKVAYIYNFAKFIDLSKNSDNVIYLCVAGDDELSQALKSLNGKLAKEKEIVVVQPVTIDEYKSCTIVFVSLSFSSKIEPIAKMLPFNQFLLVSDVRRAIDKGAHVALMSQDDRVDFDVNLAGLKMSNLKASSQMLKLARSVVR